MSILLVSMPCYRRKFVDWYLLLFQVAVPDVVEAAKNADFLIFVVPHQFIRTLCASLLGQIKPTAVGLSLIKVCNSVKKC